jgi:excisionase family DNA binding protein
VRVRDLAAHSEPYVTVAELAEYWLVGRKQIYKQIDAGQLPAIRLGPRLMRIRTKDAIDFERRANMRRPPQRAVEPAKRPVKRPAPVARRRAAQK